MRMRDRFKLEYPQPLGEFGDYEAARKAVDYLASKDFPVENLMIVGTDLQLVERVVGRRTWGRVLRQGAMGGIGTGLFLGFILMLLVGQGNPLVMLFTGVLIGVISGVLMAGLNQSLSGGKRQFDVIRDTVATNFEVFVEHRVAGEARELLAKMPGYRAGLFS